jgi:hypothetical protein
LGRGKLGHDASRVVGVFGQQPVAGFLGDVGLLAGGASGGFGVVAEHAARLAGEANGSGWDGVECARPVVAVVVKSHRNDSGPDHQRDRDAGQEYERWANQMPRIPE